MLALVNENITAHSMIGLPDTSLLHRASLSLIHVYNIHKYYSPTCI